MGAIKRKEAPVLKDEQSNGYKKTKTAKHHAGKPSLLPSEHRHPKIKTAPKIVRKAKVPAPVLETATDSDPIIESDTSEHSGEDDGESWPSADDGDGVEVTETDVERLIKETGAENSTNEAGNSTTSKESHAKQKAIAQERKASKPNADSIARAKKLWERLRLKSHVPLEERKVLVAELYEIITGRVKDFVLKHDSVRVIQTALKYANRDQRRMIAKELKGEYRGLAESRYAKFMIGKILIYGDNEIRDLVIPEFYGHVRRLIKHPEASWILDDIYRGVATSSQKALLLREWYGAEFAIFKSSGQSNISADLKSILDQNPEKRKPILHSLHDLINQLVQKKTTGFTMLHDALLEYYTNVSPGSEEAIEFIELLKSDEEGDLLKNLAFTKSGAHLVCLALAHGNAKDRKQILKIYKSTMKLLSFDTYGHQILLTAYDVVDDTVLTSKSIFPELLGKETNIEEQQENLLRCVTNLNARIPLLYLFSVKVKSILSMEDISLLDEIHAIRSTTSKKNPEIRRKELVKALSSSLLSFISANAESLVSASFGCQFISDVVIGAEGMKEQALQAIASLAQGPTEIRALLETPAANRMLKTLILGGHFNTKLKTIDVLDPPLGFNNTFYAAIRDSVLEWATGSNAFVIVGLLESTNFDEQASLKEILRSHRAQLVKATEHTRSEDSNAKTLAGRKGTMLLLQLL